jgi:agmatinase
MRPEEELSLLLRPAGGGVYLVSTGAAEQKALQRRYYAVQSDADVARKFKEALERIRDARVVLLGVPSDVGAGFRRGANLAPQALRAQLLDDDPDWHARCERDAIVDIGDVFVVPQLLDDDMLNDDQLLRARKAIYAEVDEATRATLPVSPLSIAARALELVFAINPRAKPLMLGGDHSTAWPVVKALHGMGRRFGIVQPDAHTDLLEERMGIRICFATWSFHANELIGRKQRMVQVGTRASRFEREHWESKLDVKQFWAADCRAHPERALDDIVAHAKGLGLEGVYFSNDIDGTDEAFADATGTPEPEGLSVEFVHTLIERLGREVGLVGADLVEVAPELGPDGGRTTLGVARAYLRATLAALLTPSVPAVTSRHA